MDFTMEIDNPRKRCREEEELQGDHVAKKARQLAADRDALANDSTTPSPFESGPSTPASIDVEMDNSFFQAPKPTPQPRPVPQSQPQADQRPRGTIISGWNQARRDHYLRQGYPLSWMPASTQVSVHPGKPMVVPMLTIDSELGPLRA
jgi:predicted component of type VI protein secretion system